MKYATLNLTNYTKIYNKWCPTNVRLYRILLAGKNSLLAMKRWDM